MNVRSLSPRRVAALALAAALGAGAPPLVTAQQAPAPKGGQPAVAPTVQGQWVSAGSTIRIRLQGGQATAQFTQVGPGAAAIGFKAEEVSFTATTNGPYLSGLQTTRYAGGKCHPNGRKVPMMGRVRPDGQVLAIHFYFEAIDENCRDIGQYRVSETLWQRVPDRP